MSGITGRVKGADRGEFKRQGNSTKSSDASEKIGERWSDL